MNRIEVKVLNPEAIWTAEQQMIFGCRLTQRGHQIKNMDDLVALYDKSYTQATVDNIMKLPHTTPKRFGMIAVAVVGASRRFLAQITRHQDDVHFMSASLQYSNYANEADFCVPYEVMEKGMIDQYLAAERAAMEAYKAANEQGLDNDACGYMAPQGLRNILIINATPFEWMHMISQRVCRRNTSETRYVMCLIWEALWPYSHMFHESCLPDCGQACGCREGAKFSCKHKFVDNAVDERFESTDYCIPTAFLDVNYPLIRR